MRSLARDYAKKILQDCQGVGDSMIVGHLVFEFLRECYDEEIESKRAKFLRETVL